MILIIFLIFSSGCSKAGTIATAARAAADTGNQYAKNEPQNAIPVIEAPMNNLEYDHIKSYPLAGDKGYLFTIEVTSAVFLPVDVLIMDKDNFDIYTNDFKTGEMVPFNAVIHKNVVSDTFYYSLPAQGKYYLVIENSRFLAGGADAKKAVIYSLYVKLIK
ncbi:MAG: hypothetical protein WCH76_03650 [Candidatus Riflemargulisbacteria bacterium]